MKQIPLEKIHIDLGAKMVPFAGFNMPVSYSTLTEEHLCVRNNVGMFDVSHMGEFRLKGANAEKVLQNLVTNDVSKLFPGKVQYTCLPNADGGIIDDLLVYKISDEEFFLVVNASNIEKDFDWFQKHAEDAELSNESDDWCLFAVQGPNASEVLQQLTAVDLEAMKYYTFTVDTFAGSDGVIISATGYTGAGGFEIYCRSDQAESIWKAIMEAGEPKGMLPIGLGARDTLRLEMGLCLHGNDIDETTTPLEAGLGWITKLDTGFISSDKLKSQKENGLERKLVGFEMLERSIPRQGYAIFDADGRQIGKVTSGTQSPVLKRGIGMGYVQITFAKPGTELMIEIRNRMYPARIVKPPFI